MDQIVSHREIINRNGSLDSQRVGKMKRNSSNLEVSPEKISFFTDQRQSDLIDGQIIDMNKVQIFERPQILSSRMTHQPFLQES